MADVELFLSKRLSGQTKTKIYEMFVDGSNTLDKSEKKLLKKNRNLENEVAACFAWLVQHANNQQIPTKKHRKIHVPNDCCAVFEIKDKPKGIRLYFARVIVPKQDDIEKNWIVLFVGVRSEQDKDIKNNIKPLSKLLFSEYQLKETALFKE